MYACFFFLFLALFWQMVSLFPDPFSLSSFFFLPPPAAFHCYHTRNDEAIILYSSASRTHVSFETRCIIHLCILLCPILGTQISSRARTTREKLYVYAAQSWVAWQKQLLYSFFSYHRGGWLEHLFCCWCCYTIRHGDKSHHVPGVDLGPLCVLYGYSTSRNGSFMSSTLFSIIELPWVQV